MKALAAAHREYLDAQAESHAEFLELRRRASDKLLRARFGGDEPAPAPVDEEVFEVRVDEPAVDCAIDRFGEERVEAFADGRIADCFGAGYERAASHVEHPRFDPEAPLPFDVVETFDLDGGSHEAGYLRAVGHGGRRIDLTVDRLRYGCLRAMAFLLVGAGYTLHRDGWQYELLVDRGGERGPEEREQFAGEEVVYELEVRRRVAGPRPAVVASVAVTAGGQRVFGRQHLGVRLVPGWPLDRHPEWRLEETAETAAVVDGTCYDNNALLAAALGRLEDGLGDRFRRFDGPGRIARLPGPPYLLMSRILEVEAEPGALQEGARVVTEYDVPDEGWYFAEAGTGRMPHCVLLEIGLQPCGWLSVFGLLPEFDGERFFRNLDGTGTALGEVTPAVESVRTEATLTSLSRTQGAVLVTFDVDVRADGEPIYDMETVFGFFTDEALANQTGLPTDDEQRMRRDAPSETEVVLDERPAELFQGAARLPGPMLSMIDAVTGWWPEAGEAGLGRLRAESDVDPEAWYFEAHFFQDSVQPGSLGVEAMLQLLQYYLSQRDEVDSIARPRFEPIGTDRTIEWSYRGQVLPENEATTVGIEIVDVGRRGDGLYAVADGTLWVDGRRNYQVDGLEMQLRPADAKETSVPLIDHLDPDEATWLGDHRPTYTRPALPMTVIVDRLAAGVAAHTGEAVVGLEDVRLDDWLVVDGPTAIWVEVVPAGGKPGWYEASLYHRDATPGPGSKGPRRAATARVRCAADWPTAGEPLAPLEGGQPIEDRYEHGQLFHGPAFQLLEDGTMGEAGASGVIDASGGSVPHGRLHPALLDASLHLIPHEHLSLWTDRVDTDVFDYPHRVNHLRLYGPTPADGDIRAEVRLQGFGRSERFPVYAIQLFEGERMWAEMELVGITLPKGPFLKVSADQRRAFLSDHEFVPGLGFSTFEADRTRLSVAELRRAAWFEGMVVDVYGVEGDPPEVARRVAIKDHLAQRLEVHPAEITVVEIRDGDAVARSPHDPARRFRVRVREDEPLSYVVTGGPG